MGGSKKNMKVAKEFRGWGGLGWGKIGGTTKTFGQGMVKQTAFRCG